MIAPERTIPILLIVMIALLAFGLDPQAYYFIAILSFFFGTVYGVAYSDWKWGQEKKNILEHFKTKNNVD